MDESISNIASYGANDLRALIHFFIYNGAIKRDYDSAIQMLNDFSFQGETTFPENLINLMAQLKSADTGKRFLTDSLHHYYELMGNNKSIDTIREFALIFLEEYPKAVHMANRNLIDYSFLEKQNEHLANIAVATYLEYWMEQSPECKTDSETYYQWCYKLPGENDVPFDRSKTSSFDTIPSIIRFKDTNLKLYRDMQQLQNIPQPVKNDVPKSFSFLDFSFTSAYKSRGLSLLNFTLFSKRIPSRKSIRNEQQDTQMETAWKKFFQYLQAIEDKYTSGAKMQAREYVIDCIMMQKIEKANHFQAFNQIAQRRNTPKKTTQLKHDIQMLAALYWGGIIFPENLNYARLSPSSAYTEPWEIMNFQSKVDLLYSAKTRKEIEPEICQEILKRGIMTDLMNSIYLIFPPDSMPKWDQKLFDQAAAFYHDKYNFIKEWLKYEPPTIIESPGRAREAALLYYDRVYEIYRDLLKLEDSTMGQAIAIGTAQKQQQK